MSQTKPTPPGMFLLDLLITLLTPMFLAATGGDLGLARFAAAETIESYRAETNADLIAVAQIIGFGLAALAGLSQSMDDTIPITLALRLRGNATACNRAVHQTRAALAQRAPEPPPPAPDMHPDPGPAFDEATVIAAVAATRKRAADNLARTTQQAPTPPPESTEEQYQAAWANGAATVAAEIAAEIPKLPPHQRAEATIRAAALRQCADDLLAGDVAPRLRPGDLAGLFSA